jgi:serine protease
VAGRTGRTLLLVATAVFVSAPALAMQALGGDEGPALGLIVKLKDAALPSSQAPAESAQGLGRESPQAQASRAEAQRQRLQAVMAELRLSPKALRPNGRVSQHVDFGRLLSGREAAEIAQRLRARPEVEWVVPNVRERRLQQMVRPDDEYFDPPMAASRQWWLYPPSGSSANAIEARRRGLPGIQTAWSRSTASTGAPVIAVLDTGITAHPELAGRVLPGYDFVTDVEYANDGNGRDSDPSDPGDWVSVSDASRPNFQGCPISESSWHGTIIAGILAAQTNNGVGVAAVQWGGRVLPVRVAGKCGALVTDIIDAMYWAAGLPVPGNNSLPANPNPARIVSISFGGNGVCQPYQTAVNDLLAHGVLVVAAAGNESGGATRPAKCPGVIGVAAVNRDGFKARYSNFGSEVAIATVGGDPGGGTTAAWEALSDDGLLTLVNGGYFGPQPGGSYALVAGTSFSAPVTAGVLGLMLSVHPSLTVTQLRDGLLRSARPHVRSTQLANCSSAHPGHCICTTSTCGAGLLDADEAVRYAELMRDGGSYVAPTRVGELIDSPQLAAAVSSGSDAPTGATTPTPTSSSGGSGGGAVEWGWLALLALAIVLVKRKNGGHSD